MLLIPALAVSGMLLGACSVNKSADQQANPSGQPNETTTQRGQGNGPQGSGRPNPSGMPQMDYATAATKLGVTEAALKAAMEGTDGKRVTLAEAAKTLGVTEEALRTALGIPEGGQRVGQPNGQPPTGSPPAESK